MKASNISRSTRTEVRVAKTLFIMVSVFILSMIPSIIFNLWELTDSSMCITELKNFSYSKFYTYKRFLYITFLITFYNPFWNFFIYQHRDRQFKKSLEMLKKRVQDQGRFLSRDKTIQSNI